MVGEHGDSCVFLLDSAVVGTLPLVEFAAQRGIELTPERFAIIERDVRDAAYEVRDLKGSAVQGIGLTVSGLVHALVHEVGALIPVSVRVGDRICASLPCVLGPDGPSAPLWPQMTDVEGQSLGALTRDAGYRERVAADLSRRPVTSSPNRAGPRSMHRFRATRSRPATARSARSASHGTNREVVDEAAVGSDRLGPNSCPPA